MLIKSIKLSKKKILAISILVLLIVFIILVFFISQKYGFFNRSKDINYESSSAQNSNDDLYRNSEQNDTNYENITLEQNVINSESIELQQNTLPENTTSEVKEDTDYIKWFEFNVSYDVLQKTANLDISSHVKDEQVKYNWIELISYLACKYGNNFSKFKQKDLDNIVSRLKNGETISNITKDMKNYSYYYEGYEAVLSQFIGEYYTTNPNTSAVKIITNTKSNSSTYENNDSTTYENNNSSNVKANNSIVEGSFSDVYGIKAFHPLAQGYSYSHYDDFGNSRSYGYKRLHFGNDLMGSIGTPVVAVESGYIEAVRLESVWRLENRNSKL